MKEGGQPGNTNAQKYTEEDLIVIGKELLTWMEVEDNFFFEEFLLREKDLYASFLVRYADKFPSFAKLLARSKKIQEFKLAKAGLMGDTNPQMTKFVMTNHHGYTDKTENKNDNKHSGGLNVTINKTIIGSDT